MTVGSFLLQLLTGLQIGAIYVLIALGLTLIFGTLGVANFAHGALFMIGAYLGWVIASGTGYWAAFILAPLVLLIFAIGAGAGAVAGEEERGTLDLVLAHPVRRRDFVLQRFAALVGLIAALAGVLLLSVALGWRVIKGEVVGRVKGTVVAGNAYEILSRLRGIGREVEWRGSQSLPAMVADGVAVVSAG